MTDKTKLYAVAAVVFKPDPMNLDFIDEVVHSNDYRTIKFRGMDCVDLDGDYRADHHYSFTLHTVMASSEDEARAMAVENAREKYPESDGWMSYVAAAILLDIDAYVEAALLARGLITPKDNAALSGDGEHDEAEFERLM
jgi:hypothetical protein